VERWWQGWVKPFRLTSNTELGNLNDVRVVPRTFIFGGFFFQGERDNVTLSDPFVNVIKMDLAIQNLLNKLLIPNKLQKQTYSDWFPDLITLVKLWKIHKSFHSLL
jgi:hypothetical protein